MEKEIARRISDLMLRHGKELDESIHWVIRSSADEDVARYKQAVGKILTDMLLEVMNPLYIEHPDLKPKGLYVMDRPGLRAGDGCED